MSCPHIDVVCLNQYEFVRKYRCESCGAVMMCSCDREFGEKHLPHQLHQGCVLETQQHVPVTHGFVDSICPECQGQVVSAPKAPMPGWTSKIKRYYWREIFFGTVRRLEKEGHAQPTSLISSDLWNSAEAIVVEELKREHEKNPKYEYTDIPQSETISENDVRVIEVTASYVKGYKGRAVIEYDGQHVSVEEFGDRLYEGQGYSVILCESLPFHVLFGVFTWPLIQDEEDTLLRLSSFGERKAAQRGESSPVIWTSLPADFGTPGYYTRREAEIRRYLQNLENLKSLFDEWLEDSWELRQYLWAHDPVGVEKARELTTILSDDELRSILNYLLMDYWKNYCGWPDLFIHDGRSHRFVEVKSSKDKLSPDQMNWIKGNADHMQFDFEVLKVLRENA